MPSVISEQACSLAQVLPAPDDRTARLLLAIFTPRTSADGAE